MNINKIYEESVKLPTEYFSKYELLPPCPVKRWGYRWQNFDFPRTWCILDFRDWIMKHDIRPQHLGYTCESDAELEFIAPVKKTLLSYPPYDLHDATLLETRIEQEGQLLDFFLFSQTLEHLYHPMQAMKNIYSLLAPGGYVFTSVPTINIPHLTPVHFGGFTPMGLAVLMKGAGFEIVEIGQWGNLEYIQRLFATHNWPGYDTLQHGGKVVNEERNVCQCWVLCRKME
jgi:SAM-dependent methyltransferase